MARTSLPLVALLLAATCAAPAVADEVSGTRGDIAEVRHVVDAAFDRGFLRLKVERTLHNLGPRHDQAQISIDVPDGAVATGLRTLGATAGRPHWFDADLMEAGAAAAKYQELTGIGGYTPKDPALLSWLSQSELALQVFPVAPRANKTVEYTLLMPAGYAGGRYRVTLPELGLENLHASVRVRAVHAGDRIAIDDGSPAAGAAQFVASEQHEIQLVAGDPPPFGGELSTVELDGHHAITHYSFELGPAISTVPRNAWIVILLDGSRSLDAHARRAEVRAARAYLADYADAHVLVASFDRVVRPIVGFSSIAVASAAVASLDLAGNNGSNVDSALAYAESALSATPKGFARRILLLSDTLVRQSLVPDELADRVGQSGAVLHVAVIHGGGNALTRDDAHPWRDVVRKTGGLVWDAELGAETSDAELAATVRSWVRPTSLDHVVLTGSGLEDRSEDEPLQEGERLTDFVLGDAPTPRITVRGELWSRPFETELEADPVAAQRSAALVFGSSLLPQIDESDMMPLARLGQVVSPVTSYLAVEPGVRPSTEGFEYGADGLGLSGIGEGGGGTGVGVGLGNGSSFDPQRFLDDLVARKASTCDERIQTAKANIELTLSEIVAIGDLDIEIPSANSVRIDKAVQCLREALWTALLPGEFTADHTSWNVATRVARL